MTQVLPGSGGFPSIVIPGGPGVQSGFVTPSGTETSNQPPPTPTGGGTVAGVTTPEAFGAVGDNVHDDQTAFDMAEAAILLGLYRGLELGAKQYYVSAGGILQTPGTSFFGQGPNATSIRTDANNDIVRLIHGNGCYIDGIRFVGDGNAGKANQIGVESGYLGSDGADALIVNNCVFENLGGRGISIAYGTGNSPGPILSNLRALNCGGQGFGAYTQSTWTNCVAKGCGIGLYVAGGNVIFIGGDLSANTVGVHIFHFGGPGNDAHGSLADTEINHCTSAGIVVDDGANNGHVFVDCRIYESNINIGNNEGLIDFCGCVIDPAFFNYSATSNVRYGNCSFPQGYGNIDNGLGDVEFDNPRAVSGDMPPFIGVRVWREYTFPGDANQVLTNAQSRTWVLVIQPGVISATRQLTLTRGPAQGERIRVVNLNAHTVNIRWVSGTGLAIPTTNTLDMGADGTNAKCELLGSNVAAVVP